MKKLMCAILSIIVICTLMPFNAFAEVVETSGSYEDKMTWDYDCDTKTLTVNCNGPLDFPYAEITEHFDGSDIFLYKAYPWNRNGINSEAEHLVLKGNITEIGKSVFMGFSKLKELSLPPSVEIIGALAFDGCGFEEIDIPSTVKRIEGGAFSSCNNLKRVVLNDGLEYIGSYAFRCLNLEDISIPETVKMTGTRIIGADYFNDKIKNIIQESGGFYYIDNCIIGSQRGVENAVVKDGTRFIPEYLFYEIGTSSFKSLVVSSSVKTIGEKAFYGSSIESVTFSEGVERIEESAFENSRFLSSVEFADSINHIGKSAFKGTSLTAVEFPSALEAVEELSFADSKLTEIIIPTTIKTINSSAFDGAPVTVVTADKNSRYFTVVKNVLFSKSKKSIIYYPRERKGKHYVVPYGVKYIYADFNAPKLQTVTMPKTIRRIHRFIDKSIYYFGTAEEWEKIPKPIKEVGPYRKAVEMGANCCKAKLNKTKFTYNAKTQRPKLKVYDPAGNLLKANKDYTAVFPKKSKRINNYAVKVKLKGKYKGSYKLSYRIAPKGTDFTEKSTGAGNITVKWKRVKNNITGYEIQFSKEKNFNSAHCKTYTINKRKTTKSIKNLSVGIPYYLRIRTFKTVNKKRVYSSWGKTAEITVKSPF